MGGRLHSGLRQRRVGAGLQQGELAARVGVSRQTVSALEAGQTVPATSLALALARVLGCRVEDLFWLGDEQSPLDARLVPGPRASQGGERVVLGQVTDRWVAHPMAGEGAVAWTEPADGTVRGASRRQAAGRVRIRPLRAPGVLRQNVLVAGCDPALALLAGHLAERFPAGRLHWVPAGSTAALQMLCRGDVHLAGVHLFDADRNEHNVAAVRARCAGRAMTLVNLALWEQGLVVPPGNPRKIRGVVDLARKGVKLVGREEGTGAQELLGRLAAARGVAPGRLRVVTVVRSHQAVAAAVATGAADAGVATRAAAASHGLGFVPLAEARFDLVLPTSAAGNERVGRLLEVLGSARFRADLGSLPGYGVARTGRVVAEVA
jgi:molybdate-binding protein/DNA-binding XRE family transcriptional regulator